jgi:hypothetical protein
MSIAPEIQVIRPILAMVPSSSSHDPGRLAFLADSARCVATSRCAECGEPPPQIQESSGAISHAPNHRQAGPAQAAQLHPLACLLARVPLPPAPRLAPLRRVALPCAGRISRAGPGRSRASSESGRHGGPAGGRGSEDVVPARGGRARGQMRHESSRGGQTEVVKLKWSTVMLKLRWSN